MSSSSSRHHIPFPSNFLSLNTPLKRSSSIDGSISPQDVPLSTHSFLSNRPAVPRHSSISSNGSEDSTRSAPPSPGAEASISPVPAQKSPAFLPLNSKFAAATKDARPMIGNKSHSFLSNRH